MNKIRTNKEIEILKENYPKYGKQYCCNLLGRTMGSIRQKTSDLGLRQDRNSEFFKERQEKARKSKIGKKRPGHSEFMKEFVKLNTICFGKKTDEQKKLQSINMKKWIKENGHPRGFLGKHRPIEERNNISKRSKEMWVNPNCKLNTEEHRQYLSDKATISMMNRIKTKGDIYSRANNGRYEINNKKFYFRSSWEVNYARYLEFLLSKNIINKREYEPDTFWFEGIKRGVRSYLPDFKVEKKDGSIEYHEVKGYMDDKSKTKIKRIGLYYPDTKLIVIDKEKYNIAIRNLGIFPIATLIKQSLLI